MSKNITNFTSQNMKRTHCLNDNDPVVGVMLGSSNGEEFVPWTRTEMYANVEVRMVVLGTEYCELSYTNRTLKHQKKEIPKIHTKFKHFR